MYNTLSGITDIIFVMANSVFLELENYRKHWISSILRCFNVGCRGRQVGGQDPVFQPAVTVQKKKKKKPTQINLLNVPLIHISF